LNCNYGNKLIMDNVNTEEEAPSLDDLIQANLIDEDVDKEPKPFEEPNILDSHLAQLLVLQEEVDQKVTILRKESERLHELVSFFSSSLTKLNET
jgi:hypothetical protein